MNNENISLGGKIFSYGELVTTTTESKKLTSDESKKLKECLERTFDKLSDKSQVSKIKIENSKIIFYDSNNNEIKKQTIDKKISNIFKNGVLEMKRDVVGEKIKLAAEQKSTFYLYSSGGGGHKSAKDAEMERNFTDLMNHVKTQLDDEGTLNIDVEIDEKELEKGKDLAKDPRLTNPAKFTEWMKQMGLANEADVLHDYLGKVGQWATNQWDEAQKSGDVEKQEKLAGKQWLSDFFFGPIVFFKTLISLIKLKPKQIVSTQAMATPSILLAIKLYNKFFKPKDDQEVKLHLYMTDMPTEYALHFFNSLKGLSRFGGKNHLMLHAPKIEEGKTWKELCGLDNKQVTELDVNELPVRPDFLKAVKSYKPPETPRAEIKVSEQEELQLLHSVIKHQSGQNAELGNLDAKGAQMLNYEMKEGDKGCFIMLGSQPTKSAIEGYVKSYIELARQNPNTNYHVFAFSGKFEKEKACFYKELSAHLKTQKEWPVNLRFLPLSFQTPKQLVSLEMSCDTITRSGGSTAMELLVLDGVEGAPKRERFVHAQKVEGREELTDSIPLWERGNFFFLQDKVGAAVIDPDSMIEAMKQKQEETAQPKQAETEPLPAQKEKPVQVSRKVEAKRHKTKEIR